MRSGLVPPVAMIESTSRHRHRTGRRRRRTQHCARTGRAASLQQRESGETQQGVTGYSAGATGFAGSAACVCSGDALAALVPPCRLKAVWRRIAGVDVGFDNGQLCY